MLKKLIILLLTCTTSSLWADNLVEDAGIGIDAAELRVLVDAWDPGMRQEAASNREARRAFLEQALANKRLAAEVDKITEKDDPEFFWQVQMAVRTAKLRLYLDHYRKQIKVPDMGDLAREQYLAYKEKYAAVPEKRASSHILIKCLPGVCDRKTKRVEAEKVLARLEQGESFESLVKKYSEDPGTKARKGSLDKWVWKGEPFMVRPYLAALFKLKKVGDHSGLVESRFGFHIIRLDGIQPEKYLPFDEVKQKIVDILTEQYRTLSMVEFNKSYQFSKNARIDDAALDKFFAGLKRERHAASKKTADAK